jgi:hypothetical protein
MQIVVFFFLKNKKMVSRASASVFLGEELAKDEAILNTCSMLAFDLGTEITRQLGSAKYPGTHAPPPK